jgi:hypothetical protein
MEICTYKDKDFIFDKNNTNLEIGEEKYSMLFVSEAHKKLLIKLLKKHFNQLEKKRQSQRNKYEVKSHTREKKVYDLPKLIDIADWFNPAEIPIIFNFFIHVKPKSTSAPVFRDLCETITRKQKEKEKIYQQIRELEKKLEDKNDEDSEDG